ncbi:hypothetical protein LG634_02770 [Streptomyces bambusae]|uniref:hypothetical protein n=1 Tax=Streptomyces bambusae TaxID=1550616 RepID=UPI001CFDFB6E|nr:hypothetical protein [Streptomyces bambusae]MCB5163767.1 hypothetical protein [Streptomyces bambusae]
MGRKAWGNIEKHEGEGAGPGREARERSAEERNITSPTPKDVRAKGDDGAKRVPEDTEEM